MNKKRREDIDANVKLLLKKYSSEEVGFLGAILGNVIQEKKAITKKERNILISMLNDPKEKFFLGEGSKVLSQIISEQEDIRYFVAEMQRSILKELDSNITIFTDKDVDYFKDFFTFKDLEEHGVNLQNSRIRKLIIFIWIDKTILLEEVWGEKKIAELISKMDEKLSKTKENRNFKAILDSISSNYEQEYLNS